MCVCVVVEMWSTNVGYCVRVFAQRELIFWEDINVSGWKEVVNRREFARCMRNGCVYAQTVGTRHKR